MEELCHFIQGTWSFGEGSSMRSFNPATGQVLFVGRKANEAEVHAAVFSAKTAFNEWASWPISTRQDYLRGFEAQLKKHGRDLSEIISQETGKPLWESTNETNSMINKIDISIQAYQERCPEKTTDQRPSITQLSTRHKPHGVIAVFGPFNFPGHLPNGHIVPALLAGNTAVFKPSEMTPLTAKFTMELWEKAGIPPGVLNLVQGDSSTGKLLASHPGIDGLFFTGSYQTGSLLHQQFAETPEKILALEMGGNNPLVVWDPVDAKAAAYQTIQSAFITSGQRCTCARRLIISKKSPHTQNYLDALTEMMRSIQVGPYTDQPEPFMGPVISPSAAQRLLEKQKALIAQGGAPLIEMQLLKPGSGFLSPGLIDVSAISKRKDEEVFGPLLQLIYASSFEEAIEEANNTEYGLSAALFCHDRTLYDQFFKEIEAGVINWNVPTTGASSAAPFGGIGHSGNHRPSAYYAADYCSYPVASIEAESLVIPEKTTPGVND